MSDTICFVATAELKRQIEQWAKDEDRTISATLRRILTQEATRRRNRQRKQQTATVN